MQDKRRFFSGATLEQAIANAAKHYDVNPVALAYREREKKHGFLHRRRGVVVEVNPSALLVEKVEEVVEEAVVAGPDAPTAEVSASEALESSASWNDEPVSTGDSSASRDALSGELFSEEWWHGGDKSASPEPAAPVATPSAELVQEAPLKQDAPPGVSPAPAPAVQVSPAPLLEEGPVADAVRDGLSKLLGLAGVSLESELRQGEERLEIELSGNDQRVVLDQGGEVLLAVEHLLPRVVRGISGSGVPCRVDSDGFHATREERLRELAERKAGEVGRSRRRRTLPPMSPEERRVVHMALAGRGDVSTESRGEGFYKRVTISPART